MRLNKAQWAKVAAAIAASASIGVSSFLGLSQFLGYHEGLRLIPYRDSGGVWTVCTGVTGKEVIPGKRYTPEECQRLDAERIEIAITCIRENVKTALTAQETIAWASGCYNVGETAFKKSEALRLLNLGEKQKACASFRNNYHRGGGIPHLLDDRRADEYFLCTNQLF